jgi:hypothetical protein
MTEADEVAGGGEFRQGAEQMEGAAAIPQSPQEQSIIGERKVRQPVHR